ncbi:J domain-containing protein [Chthonobacter albigriseus]|uniref:J domain-containing protein n=1 Tax=Chthonobacter albigriseus TaxID=1683161 RepID=UPI0015EECBBB|nr:DnaJ domain-containing protein [Chthonobacter albigriseus]
MKPNSKLFDKIRIRPDAEDELREQFPPCEWEGCDQPGPYKAPKGRGREGQYHQFCMDHVRHYNKSYNYFAGMGDEAVAAYQKDALTGHRPTWSVGVNRWGQAQPQAARRKGEAWTETVHDPFGMFHGARAASAQTRIEEPKRKVSSATQKALDTLGLDIEATKVEIKARFKMLVKRHHPDANGGDRSTEERLRQIIQAYNYLKTAGFC